MLFNIVKVSVNENFSTLLDFVFLDFWHEWVLNFILAEKENQKVLFKSESMGAPGRCATCYLSDFDETWPV